MAFKFLSTNLALLFLVFNFNRQIVAPDVHPMPVYDATPRQLESAQASLFVSIPTLEVKSWPEVHNAVMRGRGVEIQRKPKDQREWTKFISGRSRVAIATDFAKARGWWGKHPPESAVPKVLEKDLVKEPKWVQFTKAEYPINLPKDVEHYILWVRGPMTTRESFEAKPGETIPDERWLTDGNHVDELIQFIHAHDAFGSNIDPKKYDPDLKIGEGLWRAPTNVKHGYNGPVSMEEGIKAMLWSSRHVTRLIEAQFPRREFVWFRVNRSLRNFHVPNEIHVLVRRR